MGRDHFKLNKKLSLFSSVLLASTMGVANAQDLPAVSHNGEMIVKFKTSNLQYEQAISGVEKKLEELNKKYNLNLEFKRPMATGAQLISFDSKWFGGQSLEEMAKVFSSLPDVEYAVPNIMLHPMATPDDSRYGEQWHYFEETAGINAPDAWDVTQGEDVIVAVLDTGYTEHADLIDNIVGGYDFISSTDISRDGDGRDADARDEGTWFGFFECSGQEFRSADSNWHGTHVAGTVAAVSNNSIGVAGVAYNAKILPMRVLGKCGGILSDASDAMLWAAGLSVSGIPDNPNPAKVINLSLGAEAACDEAMQDAIDRTVEAGATVVVSAGNSDEDAISYSPAGCDNIITVGAYDRNGDRAWYSNFGDSVEISGPGGDISDDEANGVLSTVDSGTTTPEGDTYAGYQGTSMSAPHVAGVAAMLYSIDPDITPDEVLETLQNSARPFSGDCEDCGAGMLDAAAAVAALQGDSNQRPSAGFSTAISELTVNFNDSSSDSDGNIASWSWDFGDGNSSSDQNPSHTYSSSGSYDVTLTVTDNEGSTDSENQTVAVSDGSGEAPTSSFSFSASDLEVSFTDESNDSDGSIDSWSWDFGDDNSSSEQNPTHNYASAGTYSVSLTVTDNDGMTHTSSQEVTVTEPVSSEISLNVSTSVLFGVLTQITLEWSGASGSEVDIFENGSLSSTVDNDGSWTSNYRFGTVNSTFKVCEAGTDNCSDEVSTN